MATKARRRQGSRRRNRLNGASVDEVFNALSGVADAEINHGAISHVSPFLLLPSPENDQLYRPVDPDDPEIVEMAASMRAHGVLQALIVTSDHYVVSGHRRLVAAKLAGLATVPVVMLEIRRDTDPDGFVRLLREHNRQRDKTLDEKLREEVVSLNADNELAAMYAYRREQAAVDCKPLKIVGKKHRAEISAAKLPLLRAMQKIVEDLRDYWPISDRRVHYELLNDPPLTHASKRGSKYRNDAKSYKKATELLTRARLAGLIAFEAICDETRPVTVWQTHPDPRAFVRGELKKLMRGYCRSLQQSQPNHIEILVEKNTNANIIEPVAMEYTLPMTSGRGYSSLPPRHAIAERFRKGGKEKLVLLIVSDFDPEGEDIAHSFARSLRDDFDIENVHAIKVALTAGQIAERKLPRGEKAKAKSSRRKKFVQAHGEYVYELEALKPADLQQIVRAAIESVIDRDAYSAEIEAERDDAVFLATARTRMLAAVKGIGLEADE